jgi:2-phospho-L-lactate/phosphoenolpyruvate guanylyltransferase
MRATVVLPIKRFHAAKQRLAAGLGGEQRRQLAEAMLADVLEAIGGARMVERVIVVSGDEQARRIAEDAGAELVDDPDDAGHPEAALLGIERAKAAGATAVALLPGDCPLLNSRELDNLLTGLPDPYAAIVPDRHGTGTNALVLSPPDAIRPAFGPDSCQRHQAAAREAGIPYGIERLDSLALDLDTPADIIALTRELEGGRGQAPRTAKALGI